MTLPEPLKSPDKLWVPVRHKGKPRLLYVITRAEFGGAQVHVRDLAVAMQTDFEVSVAVGEEGFLTDECRRRAIAVYILPHLQRRVLPTADIRALWELGQLIQRLQPDLMHVHTFKAGFLGRLAGMLLGIPTIYTIHTWLFGTPAMPRLWRMLGGPCERLAAGWCERMITVCDAGAKIAQTHRIGPQAKIVTIHNGIPDCPERANLEHANSPVITMVARFSEQKGHENVLRAFALILPGPHLRLIGSGPLRERSERLARQLGIQDRVEFLGDREDVAALLAASDVFVLASKFEMFALSILEAMRAGLPVIASDVGGNREAIVEGETGYLVPSGSITALAEALSLVLDNLDLRLRLGRAARKRFAELFQFSQQERDTRGVYQKVMCECRRVTPLTQPRTSLAHESSSQSPRKIAA